MLSRCRRRLLSFLSLSAAPPTLAAIPPSCASAQHSLLQDIYSPRSWNYAFYFRIIIDKSKREREGRSARESAYENLKPIAKLELGFARLADILTWTIYSIKCQTAIFVFSITGSFNYWVQNNLNMNNCGTILRITILLFLTILFNFVVNVSC